ncbi:CLUMA_CG002850, isoform A [Clunio marinus]|uniref:CLUMA_CG002850, isoform A n=1 Tax=Clunio marinus TaxID=568069 RepID=A0A1J1HMZ6_9DIPT|nr:CLUMA_CG002850, isoform A [Clunio marinus]
MIISTNVFKWKALPHAFSDVLLTSANYYALPHQCMEKFYVSFRYVVNAMSGEQRLNLNITVILGSTMVKAILVALTV